MKICIIYGNPRKETTYNCVKIFKESLQKQSDVEFIEFTLPKDMPYLCVGCFECFTNGEDTCPHASSVQPIAKAMLESDGIILSSPVYACDVASSIKALFDHLCYMWVSHRPQIEMFNKVVMVISTTAGAGVHASIKSLKKSPRYWCVKRIHSLGIVASASCWSDVPQKKKIKFKRKLEKRASQFLHSINNREKLNQRLQTKLIFPLMAKMIGGYNPEYMLYRDKQHWQRNGWLDGKKPW